VEQLAKMVGLKRRQIAALARNGEIPSAIRPDGYHYEYPLTPELLNWIEWKRRQVEKSKQPVPKRHKETSGIISIRGMRHDLEIWRLRIEQEIDTWDDEVLEGVRLELTAFVDLHSRITKTQEARKSGRAFTLPLGR
jgi:hypothetical protein